MAATIWKGVIEFGKVSIPVRFLSAVQDRTVRFNLLHAPDMTPVKQVMVNPESGEWVPSEQIRRGFAVSEDTYVVVHDDELEKLRPKESRSIHIESFVPRDAVPEQLYERAYYLGSDPASDDYAALARALETQRLEGIARWVMRKRSYVGSVHAVGGILVMVTMHYADEVIAADSLPKPEGRKLDKKELQLADQLVEALFTQFEPTRYRDEYQERLLKFIMAKAEGKKPRLRLVKPPKVTGQDDLTSVLAASMKALKKERRSA